MWQHGPTRRGVLAGVTSGSLLSLATTPATTQGEPVTVTILGTNDPVTTGSVLEVMAELENDSDSQITRDVALIVGHDPQQVDSASVTIGPNGRETVTLTFETAIVDNDQEFPARVVSGDAADERNVLVTAGGSSVTVDIFQSNDPVATGEYLEVTARVENTGESTVTEQIVLIVGHNPQQVDSETVTLTPGTSQLVSLGYETAMVANTQEFPVRVESSDDAAERTVRVVGTNDDPVETAVTFPSCTRAEVSGMFSDGDTVAASTGFYDETNGDALYGNTLMEDWIEIGTHVDAPFSGTIVFEIGDERSVSETADGAYVEVPDYGDLGTVLTGITLPQDYTTATISESNPQAESCLNDIEDGAGGDAGALSVSITGTNEPVRAGSFLEVTARLENTGDETASQDVVLIVGHDPQQVDSTAVSLEGGASDTVSLGYETYPAARTTTFPVRIESEDDADERTVEVIGTDAE